MQTPTARPVPRLLARLRLKRRGVLLAGLLIYILADPFSVGQGQLRLAVDGFLLLVLLEQVAGVMCVAFLVARLANIHQRRCQAGPTSSRSKAPAGFGGNVCCPEGPCHAAAL
jgi:hypothetical protein